jgi:hypothetical protein
VSKEDIERARAYLPGLDAEYKKNVGLGVVGGRVHLPWGDDFWIRRDLHGRKPKMLYPKDATMPAYYEPPLTDAGREDTTLYIVESPFCALYAASADFNCVAMGGLRMTDGLVKHATGFDRVVLAFDNDDPGQAFIEKAAEQLAPHVRELYKCQLPNGRKDIRDIVVFATDMGMDDWQQEVTLALTGDIAKVEVETTEGTLLEEAMRVFKLVDLSEFEKPLPPQRFIVEPWLCRAEVCSFTSLWKTGKSWLLLDLLLSVAGFKDTWLDMPVTHGPVLYIDEENGLYELQRRMQLITGRNLGSVKDNFHLVTHSGLMLDDEKYWLPLLFEFVQELQPTLIVFDATSRFHELDENSSREMAYLHKVAFKPLAKTRFDCAVIAADHPTKSLMGTPRDFLQAVRGSGDKIAQVERLWYLVKPGADEDVVTLHHPGIRTGAIPPPITIRRKFEDEGMWHEVLGRGDKVARDAATEADLNSIVEYIRSKPTKSAHRDELIELTSEDRAVRALSLGVGMGMIAKEPDPDNRRRKIYRVANPDRLMEDE